MTFQELLDSRRVVLSDGAWGTELAKLGVAPGGCPELVNAEHPDTLREVARSYVTAGADIILTNTFGGSPYKLAKYGLDERTEELNELGTRLSREATDGVDTLVAASLGPTGEFLAPLGTVTGSEMTRAFSRQVAGFIKGGADAVVIETMTDLGEILAAVAAIRDTSDLPVICSLTFDKGLREYATMMGVTPAKAIETLEAAGVDAIGANCGAGIDTIIEIARLMAPLTHLPLWFKPNAGLPELIQGETVFRETPERMAAHIPSLVEAGAKIVGGCCGTTPAHIAVFRETIDRLNRETV